MDPKELEALKDPKNIIARTHEGRNVFQIGWKEIGPGLAPSPLVRVERKDGSLSGPRSLDTLKKYMGLKMAVPPPNFPS